MVLCCTDTWYACGCQSCVDESEGVRKKKKAEGGKRRDLLEKGRRIGLEVVNWRLDWRLQSRLMSGGATEKMRESGCGGGHWLTDVRSP